jgi:iron complex outermembrane recepter protein
MSLFLIAALAAAPDAEVIVTAERRAQSAISAPASIARLEGPTLERIDAQHPAEALNRLPGVNIQRGSGVESLPAIRSPVLTGGQGAGSFLVLEDGVPVRAPGFSNINQLFETSLDFADAVEVTRGPGSALYGSNAVHGLVNVITPINSMRPGLATYSARAAAGSFGRAAGQGLAFVDQGEGGIAYAAGLSLRHEGGWRDAAGVDQQHAYFAYAGGIGRFMVDASLVAQQTNQETAGFVEGPDAYKDRALARANANPEAFRDTRLIRTRINLETIPFENATLKITPFARWVDTDLLLHFFPSRALEETGQHGGGVQTALYIDPSETLSFIVGADLDVTRGRLREFQSRPTTGAFTQGLHYDYRVDMAQIAGFAQAAWKPAPDWTVTAGVRGETVRYAYDNRAPNNDVGRFRRPADRSDDFTTITPKLSLAWAGQDRAAFVNVAAGARAPQITDLYSLQTLQQPGAQKAETINSGEVGFRQAWTSGRIEVVGYAMEKRNAAFRNASGFTVANAKTRHRGVEASGRWTPIAPLTFTGWASFSRHTYAFSDSVAAAGESIRKGAEIDTAPRWQGNLAALYQATNKLELEAEWVAMGRSFTNAANTRTYPGHDVIHLRAGYQLTPTVQVALAVRNLADAAYAERADFAFNTDRYFPGEPRAATLSVRFKAPAIPE